MPFVQNVGSKNFTTFFAYCERLGDPLPTKFLFLRARLKAYPFLFNTFLTFLGEALLILERYCIFFDVKFPPSVFRTSFSVINIFLSSLFDFFLVCYVIYQFSFFYASLESFVSLSQLVFLEYAYFPN